LTGDLAALRHALDDIDREIVKLFEKRMDVSRAVAACKLENGLPVLDAGREEQVLNTRAEMLSDKMLDSSCRALFQEIMRLSRLEQEKFLKRSDVQ
jgi:monofunctional chorismate mutase